MTHIKMKLGRKTAALLLSIFMVLAVLPTTGLGIKAEAAASNLSGIGLAEFGLKAYRDGWQYNYGSYGQLNSNGIRISDCSGLIFAYLCWAGDNSNPKPDYSMPRTVVAQVNASSQSGPISTLPRTHGLILTISNYDHVGIYLGGGMEVDCNDYGTNMVYRSVEKAGYWLEWHKLNCIEYPTNGWYKFDGSWFFYEDGQYIINTTRNIDGVSYSFGADGKSSSTPGNASSGSSSTGNSASSSDTLSISASTTALVNLRSGMSTSTSVVKLVNSGTALTIINKDNSSWYKVKLSDGTTGYIYSEYLKEGSAASSDEEAVEYSTTEYVNIREGAGTNYNIIKTVNSGTKVSVVNTSNSNWYKIKLGTNSYGYIYSEYLKKGGSSSSSSSSTGTSGSADTAEESYTTTAVVNIRSGAGTNYSILKTVNTGTSVSVVNKSNANWYKLKLGSNSYGYIYSEYVKKSDSSSSGESSSSSGAEISESYKATAYVNVRKGAGTNNGIIRTIPSGTSLTVTDKSNSAWYKVKLADGTVGYISSEYLAAASSGNSESSSGSGTEYKTTEYVNLRTGAGTNNSIITTVASGTTVTVTDTSNATWFKVKLSNGTTGYMCSDYLSTGDSSSSSSSGRYKTTDAVNLRKGTGTNYGIITVVGEGTSLDVTDTGNSEWYKVKLSDGSTGYIFSEYLKKA